MKKLILMILLFITTLLSAQEIIVIYDDYELYVPYHYTDLKNDYIIMATLYLQSDAALTKSIQNFKDLKVEYDRVVKLLKESEDDNKTLTDLINNELNPNAKKLEDEIDVLTDELEKWIKPDLIRLYAGGSFSNEIIISNIHMGGFVALEISEQFFIKAEYLLPDQYSIGIGYRIF